MIPDQTAPLAASTNFKIPIKMSIPIDCDLLQLYTNIAFIVLL